MNNSSRGGIRLTPPGQTASSLIIASKTIAQPHRINVQERYGGINSTDALIQELYLIAIEGM
ncbi:hypothetical protein [Erwinia amylovora]|uniref:Uncharacterized protein n=1 Tax=Erwinia amylovora (strain CFBP1430) TaxID=665029 RepID=D4I269_ERWAC|nr:hypothetical protein [Erwinia amylovora]MCK8156910.1 hypothetical protein [Erwinia amylovora]MCK8160458.1 hypothetical protein [Erwinia amylovora]MCK8163750.1 hypothetical protein [Erwinia amylovora]MCK8167209.1 hypothetical protein [Erwinia amylovora]MCK8173759.1 hypothetical protein [Erwinia amylovora]